MDTPTIALLAQSASEIRRLTAELEAEREKVAHLTTELATFHQRDEILKVASAIREQGLLQGMSDEELVQYVATQDLGQLSAGVKLASSELRLGSVSSLPGGAPSTRQQVDAALSAHAGGY